MRPTLAASCGLSLLLSAACTSDDDAGDGIVDEPDAAATPSASAPEIFDLSFTPTELVVGQQNPIRAGFVYLDADADVATVGIEFQLPDGSRQLGQPLDLGAMAVEPSGHISLDIAVTPPTPGDYAVFLWLTDAAGLDSNRLVGRATAE